MKIIKRGNNDNQKNENRLRNWQVIFEVELTMTPALL